MRVRKPDWALIVEEAWAGNTESRFTSPRGVNVKCCGVVNLNPLELELCEFDLTETLHHIFSTDRDSEAAIFIASGY